MSKNAMAPPCSGKSVPSQCTNSVLQSLTELHIHNNLSLDAEAVTEQEQAMKILLKICHINEENSLEVLDLLCCAFTMPVYSLSTSREWPQTHLSHTAMQDMQSS